MAYITRCVISEYVVKIPNTLEAFRGWEFSSGGVAGDDFKVFARKFRSYIKNNLPSGAELLPFKAGHYHLSGFIKRGKKYVYFSISDVRFFPAEWYNNILIRTAQHDKDYTGGLNCYTTLERFKSDVGGLL